MNSYDPLYIKFLYLFNIKADYYECHDVMEELWLTEGRDLFYQGLLQVAVGLYHFQNQNIGGAQKLFAAAVAKLAHYPVIYQGIDVDQLRQEVKGYLEQLARFAERPFAFYPFKIQIKEPALQQRVDEQNIN